jgi:hypothetical protein
MAQKSDLELQVKRSDVIRFIDWMPISESELKELSARRQRAPTDHCFPELPHEICAQQETHCFLG